MKTLIAITRRLVATLILAALAAGCDSTPRHTNTLIFGTNTKFGIDVSQDPAASAGVTVGYKRQEAVWMPLMPNQAFVDRGTLTSTLVPGTCSSASACPMFVGEEGGSNKDTYSVLASFGAKFNGGTGNASGVGADGGIAQYFATGLAARYLALGGGAALVNAQGGSVLTQSERADLVQAAAARSVITVSLQADLLDRLAAADKVSVDPARMTKALGGAAVVSAPAKTVLASAKTLAEVRDMIRDFKPDKALQPMLKNLNAP